MRRLFIAINLPKNIKEKIRETIERIKENAQLPEDIRWTPPENWHLTLTFLGYQPDENIPRITEAIQSTIKNCAGTLKSTEIIFEKLSFAPAEKQPRMIWLSGDKETSKNLSIIKNELDNLLNENGVKFKIEHRNFNSHITLARFEPLAKSEIENIKLPAVEKLNFRAKSLDLMESHLKRTGAEYEILTSLTFSGK